MSGIQASKTHVIHSRSPDETAGLARAAGATLCPGDTILLSGEIGAGKTHFARALIQSLLAVPEDVPSPTFTLVQEYDTKRGPLWHADLYRIGDVDQVAELGLADAFHDAICLVEWPEILHDLVPDTALRIRFAPGAEDESRSLTLSWRDPCWDTRLPVAA